MKFLLNLLNGLILENFPHALVNGALLILIIRLCFCMYMMLTMRFENSFSFKAWDIL